MRTLETVALQDIDDAPLSGDDALSAHYAERMLAGDVFPPVNLGRNQHGVLCVCDGRHRIRAMLLLGWQTCDAIIDSTRD